MSDPVLSHRWQPTRLSHPWDSPGKNTGVGCHFLLQCVKVKSESEVAQSCPTLSDPMDCSLPGSSVHGSFQTRVLEWGAIAFSIVVYYIAFKYVLIDVISLFHILSSFKDSATILWFIYILALANWCVWFFFFFFREGQKLSYLNLWLFLTSLGSLCKCHNLRETFLDCYIKKKVLITRPSLPKPLTFLVFFITQIILWSHDIVYVHF